MIVKVLMFAHARDLVGETEATLQVPDDATVADVREGLWSGHEALRPLLEHCSFSVDQHYADDDFPVTPHSEIACIPPVSGG